MNVDAVPGLRSRLPELEDKTATAVHLKLHDGHFVDVDGFGKEFSNPGHPCEEYLIHRKPMVNNKTILDVLNEREFFLVVACPLNQVLMNWQEKGMPPPFDFAFAYGKSHDFNLYRTKKQLQGLRSEPFRLSVTYDSANSRVAVQTQAVLQDNYWLAQAAAEIFATKFFAYFVPAITDGSTMCQEYYVVIRMNAEFKKDYADAWDQLIESEFFHLAIHADADPLSVPELSDHRLWKQAAGSVWLANVVGYPPGVTALSQHAPAEDDLVLHVKRGKSTLEVPTFVTVSDAEAAFKKEPSSWTNVSLLFDSGLDEDERKVRATCQLAGDAQPSHRQQGSVVSMDLRERMGLHRLLHQGRGYYKFLKEWPFSYSKCTFFGLVYLRHILTQS